MLTEAPADTAAEIDGDTVGEHAATRHPDSEGLADAAVASIGRDEVAGAYGGSLAAVAIANYGCDTCRILLERLQVGAEANLGAPLFRALLQERLE